MPISVTCSNGHKLRANETLAGRSLPCPACGETVAVPALPAPDDEGIEDPLEVVSDSNELLGDPLADLSDLQDESVVAEEEFVHFHRAKGIGAAPQGQRPADSRRWTWV